jgi:hypothetical protein
MKKNSFIQRQFRKKVRIYILPTKMGGYFNGLIFLMFLLSVGYSNNLLLIFTLFLFGFNLLWVVQSHFHLHGLKLNHLQIPNGHVDELLPLSIFWSKSPEAPLEWQIILEDQEQQITTHLFQEGPEVARGELKLTKRGLWKWRYLRVSTSLPFGLYRTWVYYPLKHETFAFPKIRSQIKAPPLLNLHRSGELPQEKAGPEDIRNLAPYQGEEFRRISWKHYARSGELYIKEGEDLSAPLWKHFLHPPADPKLKENYLSELATFMVYCHRHQIPFYFETSTEKWGPSFDENHLSQCLKVLSLC